MGPEQVEPTPGCGVHWSVLVGCLAVLLVAIAALIWLPWWVNLLIVVGITVLGGPAFEIFYFLTSTLPTHRRAAALLGAEMRVHRLDPAPAPESPGEFRWYWLELTIIPAKGAARWEPDYLWLATFDHGPMRFREGCEDPCTVGPVGEHQVLVGGEFVPADDRKVVGEQRLRLLLGAYPHLASAKLRYRTVTVGEFSLPGEGPATEPA